MKVSGEAIRHLLRSAAMVVFSYASAEEFLESPQTTRVDCLIVDVNLPGMNGVALLERVASSLSPVPAILISARDDPATRALVCLSSAVPFLRKPFGDEDLFGAIGRVLRR